MEEVRVLAETICVGLDALGDLLLLVVLLLPLIVAVVALGRLQSLQHLFVVANDACKVTNSYFTV